MKSSDFKRINPYLYEIPAAHRPDMRVPARFYADAELLQQALGDKSLDQLANSATLPGIVAYALAMPDIHQGYGFPIGGVVATRVPDGVISPGGVGYDINCGVRLLGTRLSRADIAPYLDELATQLQRNCPHGVGRGGEFVLNRKQLEDVVRKGAGWALERGYATPIDLELTEENGRIEGADPAKISARAYERARDQLGTLGSGNHFIELDVVDDIFDETAATRMGLFPGQIVAQIHCGSRGFGHQVCTDYVARFQRVVHQYGIVLPDRELVCAPLSSPEGQDYLAAMKGAANFAFANRQLLTHLIRRSFDDVLAGKVDDPSVYQIYDIAHNMAKIEEHEVDGKRVRVCVHRKGATRAFGPGSAVLPDVYRDIGQPVLVPGSMGTASWVLVGTEGSMAQSFGSTCHGAGRVMSRSRAKREVQGDELRRGLESRGIRVRAGSLSGLAEEAPQAYKDVDRVIEVVHGAGIARKVARLVPVAVVKG
ncbi:MAG TPA: RtcB family protein [Promineifilum sp.]|nr:RtcB family protein [Promineifilum sp.]HRQ12191.1 RtcB family protein [Promineifilum sp.]